jgi:hypothetical protein
MPVAKSPRTEVRDATPEFFAAAAEFTIIEYYYPTIAERLDGGDVIAEITRQSV